jgi:hypothetical protein
LGEPTEFTVKAIHPQGRLDHFWAL